MSRRGEWGRNRQIGPPSLKLRGVGASDPSRGLGASERRAGEELVGAEGVHPGFLVKSGEGVGGMGDRGDTKMQECANSGREREPRECLGARRAWKCRRADIFGWVHPLFAYVEETMKLRARRRYVGERSELGDRIQIFGKLKWPTLGPKLYRPGRDTVEQVAAKGRSAGESHEQKDGRYELNQEDSKDRGPVAH